MDLIEDFKISSLLDTIENELSLKHFIAALFMVLTVPDICSGENASKKEYIEWYDNWVTRKDPKSTIDGKKCYSLRCCILHSGITNETISLSYDSTNEIHLGHIITTIITNDVHKKEEKYIRINIEDFARNIIQGAKEFINDTYDAPLLRLMDYGKINRYPN